MTHRYHTPVYPSSSSFNPAALSPSRINRIVFLGTASAVPQPGKRNTSSLCVQLSSSSLILIDCGEATQHQFFLSSSLRLSKIDCILITHLHGDHVFGVFGLLCTMSLQGREKEVLIVGPRGVEKMINTVLEMSGGFYSFPLVYHLLDHPVTSSPDSTPSTSPDLWHSQSIGLIAGGQILLTASPLVHRLPAFAYIIEELPTPGTLNSSLAAKLGAKPKDMAILKSGKDVEVEGKEGEGEGEEALVKRVIRSIDVVGPSKKGVKVAVLQDTSDSTAAESECHEVDVLIHESTYGSEGVGGGGGGGAEKEGEMERLAIERGHSTAKMAGLFAKKVEAKQLILTHFSPRYGVGKRLKGTEIEGGKEKGKSQLVEEKKEETIEKNANKEKEKECVRGVDFTQDDLVAEAAQCCPCPVYGARDFMVFTKNKEGQFIHTGYDKE